MTQDARERIVSAVLSGDSTVAAVPVVPANLIPQITRVNGKGLAHVGGLIELRGTNLAKVKRVEIAGAKATFYHLGNRLLVIAPPLRAGGYPIIVITEPGASDDAQLVYTPFLY